jgi:glycosyltransferase involved in cell wall biosynthesis
VKKVLVILDNDLINDGRVLKEIDILKKANFDYRVLCYDYGKNYNDDKSIVRIKNGKFLKNKLQAFVNSIPLITNIWASKIKQVLKTFEADIIHIHDLYMMPPVQKAIKKNLVKAKLVLDLHENYPYAIYNYQYASHFLKKHLVLPRLWKKKERSILSATDGLIVLDKTFGEQLSTKYPELKKKQFLEFPNYPDYSKLVAQEKIDFSIDENTMLYFGGVAKSRGISESIQAFNKVNTKLKNSKYLIIGPVNKAYRKEFFDLLKGNSNIQYIDWINIKQLSAVMQKCKFAIAPFYVNPQIESGIANKIFQYLYGKLPVIVSNARPMANLITKYNCGSVFKNNDEMHDAIHTYFSNTELCKEHGLNGHKAIIDNYNADKFEKQFISFYESF